MTVDAINHDFITKREDQIAFYYDLCLFPFFTSGETMETLFTIKFLSFGINIPGTKVLHGPISCCNP